jgi:hypothetical protein
MFKMSLKYVDSVFFSRTGPSSGNTFLRSLLHCAPGAIVLSMHVVVIIYFDDVGCFSSYLFYCGHFLCPTGCAARLVVCILCCFVFPVLTILKWVLER